MYSNGSGSNVDNKTVCSTDTTYCNSINNATFVFHIRGDTRTCACMLCGFDFVLSAEWGICASGGCQDAYSAIGYMP